MLLHNVETEQKRSTIVMGRSTNKYGSQAIGCIELKEASKYGLTGSARKTGTRHLTALGFILHYYTPLLYH